MIETVKQDLTVASFFSGIGGFDLGFEQAGAEVVFQCEKDSFCQKVLRKHWPDVELASDIDDVDADAIPNATIWCGGFPCQDLSLANQGKRLGLEGERSGLFNRFAELVDRRKPEWIVLENVPGLLNSNGGRDFRHVLKTLDDFGYFVAWRVFDAKYFGTPQRRRRIFIVASYRTDSAARVLFDEGISREVALPSYLPQQGIAFSARNSFSEADLFSIQHATIGRKPDAGPQGKGYRNDGETYTLDSRGSADVICAPYDGFGIRNTPGLSPELDARRLRSLGNAVCVHVVRWIAQGIVSVIAENSVGGVVVVDSNGLAVKEFAHGGFGR